MPAAAAAAHRAGPAGEAEALSAPGGGRRLHCWVGWLCSRAARGQQAAARGVHTPWPPPSACIHLPLSPASSCVSASSTQPRRAATAAVCSRLRFRGVRPCQVVRQRGWSKILLQLFGLLCVAHSAWVPCHRGCHLEMRHPGLTRQAGGRPECGCRWPFFFCLLCGISSEYHLQRQCGITSVQLSPRLAGHARRAFTNSDPRPSQYLLLLFGSLRSCKGPGRCCGLLRTRGLVGPNLCLGCQPLARERL